MLWSTTTTATASIPSLRLHQNQENSNRYQYLSNNLRGRQQCLMGLRPGQYFILLARGTPTSPTPTPISSLFIQMFLWKIVAVYTQISTNYPWIVVLWNWMWWCWFGMRFNDPSPHFQISTCYFSNWRNGLGYLFDRVRWRCWGWSRSPHPN